MVILFYSNKLVNPARRVSNSLSIFAILACQMFRIPPISAWNWAEKALMSAINFLVFTFLDFLDVVLCIFYRLIDGFMDGNAYPCYCDNRGKQGFNVGGVGEDEVSETLYERKNVFRELGLVKLKGKEEGDGQKGALMKKPRWSDCSCNDCGLWQGKGEEKLHLVVMEPLQDCRGHSAENVIFLHGFLSSSSLWTESVFPNLSETARLNYRLFAVDLLGFGKSPKPRECLYRLKEHLGMIEKSVIKPYRLNSFHLVAHSMGCIMALSLAAKNPESIKSITLIAPPYFPSSKEKASYTTLNRLAERRLWPPLLFGSSVMSWYEHLGRTICVIVCRNHRKWEWIMKILTWKRDLNFTIIDLTKHTHHSAWHTMHNVICGGAKFLDDYLAVVSNLGVLVTVIQGDRDQVVPLECSYNIKLKVPHAELKTISDVDHNTVILGREKEFTRDLEKIWVSSAENHKHKTM